MAAAAATVDSPRALLMKACDRMAALHGLGIRLQDIVAKDLATAACIRCERAIDAIIRNDEHPLQVAHLQAGKLACHDDHPDMATYTAVLHAAIDATVSDLAPLMEELEDARVAKHWARIKSDS
jgi:hypothetical protein